ncbi:MAG: GNAT family N-acetyltransferase [Actinomycetota bacterium]|nr:GNAT family N-acetyltransferase [Actinomycetota bacterium]
MVGERVILRAIDEGDAGALRAIHSTPEVSEWWKLPSDEFPFEDHPRLTQLTIDCDGAVVGLIQFGEEHEADERHAWIDIFVDPARHRQGLATDALATLVRHLTEERGHHRIVIDPVVDNEAAVRCYESVGFDPVGVMHESWRDAEGAWRDCLLMEMIVRQPPRPGPG